MPKTTTTAETGAGPAPDADADAFLAAALRQVAASVPLSPDAAARLTSRAAHHGVSALVAANPAAMAALPTSIAAELRAAALSQAMWDLRHRQVLMPLLSAFAAAEIPAILLKGTALAYSLYPSPSLRQRGDSDILLPRNRAAEARAILAANGFRRNIDSKAGLGDAANRQEAWTHTGADGGPHVVEPHRGVMAAWALDRVLPAAEVIGRAVTLPALGPGVRRLTDTDALYHACLHRAVHVQSPYFVGEEMILGGDRLIWLHDIHLLAPRLTDAAWQDFVATAARDGTSGICHGALARAQALLATPIPTWALAHLANGPTRGPIPAYLTSRSLWMRLLRDLAALPGPAARVAHARAILLPDGTYLRDKYPDSPGWPLPLLHARRLAERLARSRPR